MNHETAVRMSRPGRWDVKCSCGWRNVDDAPFTSQDAEDMAAAHRTKAKYSILNTGPKTSSLKKLKEYYDTCAASDQYSIEEREQWQALSDGLKVYLADNHEQDKLF